MEPRHQGWRITKVGRPVKTCSQTSVTSGLIPREYRLRLREAQNSNGANAYALTRWRDDHDHVGLKCKRMAHNRVPYGFGTLSIVPCCPAQSGHPNRM